MIDNSKSLAIALQYAAPHAPKVTAIGRGELARRIVDVGTASGVPISENPALAVALSNVEIDQEFRRISIARWPRCWPISCASQAR